MLWERINAKPLVTIVFFKIFDKSGNFTVLICCAVPVPANQYISTQKQDLLYFNSFMDWFLYDRDLRHERVKFSAELNKLIPSF